jgi:predicted nucleic acid-binding protein
MKAVGAIRELCPSPVPITLVTHDAALGIASRTGYQFYDALIIASALESGCTTLFSEDLQDGQVVEGRLTICNPFGTSGQ